MKKTYISPNTLVVEIRTNHMLAESVFINASSTETAGWTREENASYSDKNVWDDEW